jgi:pentatricopeptide repeat protein
VPKDAFTFSGVISACEQLGQWERAVQFYVEMLRDGVARPSVVVLNTCLQACVTGRQWRRALELLVHQCKTLGLVTFQ